MASPKQLAARARERLPLVDHLVRAFSRYQADGGDRLAAAVTYFWFLSLFPILLLSISILGYALGDDAQQQVVDGIGDQLPGGLAETIGEVLTEAKGPAGIIGVLGLLFAGLGWVDALREAIRTVWHQNTRVGNIIVKKLRDVVVLLGLLAVIGTSVVASSLITGFTGEVLDLLDLERTTASTAVTRTLGYALALLADTVLFLYLFTRLARVRTPVRAVLRGAVFGAVGFEVLKVVGGIYVASTTKKGEATYGAFAVVVGLLLFLYLLSRLILFSAVFAVTARDDSDIAPSGTADARTARKAGIPVELADGGPKHTPSLTVDGAPTPLQHAVRGPATEPHQQRDVPPDPPADHPTAPTDEVAVPANRPARPPARSWSAPAPVHKAPAPEPAPAAGPPPAPAAASPALVPDEPLSFVPENEDELDRLRAAFPPPRPAENDQERLVVLAARGTAVAGGVVLAATGLYALRTLTGILRRS